jgi:integrase
MPLSLRPPRKGKTPNFEIRGTYLGCRVEVSSGTDRRSVARKQLRKIEACIEEHGKYPAPEIKPDPGQPTFLSAAVAYLQAGGSRRHVAGLIKYFRETPIDDIDQAAIDEAARILHPDVLPVTLNGYVYTPVSAILHHAGRKITVKRPKGYKGKPVTRFLLPPDAFAILEAATAIDAEMGRLLTFLLYTGCRIGEALALKWENVDLAQRLAYIETSKNDDPRSMKLRQNVCDLLAPHSNAAGRVFRFKQGGYRNFIFLNAKVTACGLAPVARPRPGEKMVVPPHRLDWVTFHTFCHTWATWMRRFGGADVQGLVATNRWRDARSAARYTHVDAHQEWDRVDALPDAGWGNDGETGLPLPKDKQNQR